MKEETLSTLITNLMRALKEEGFNWISTRLHQETKLLQDHRIIKLLELETKAMAREKRTVSQALNIQDNVSSQLKITTTLKEGLKNNIALAQPSLKTSNETLLTAYRTR